MNFTKCRRNSLGLVAAVGAFLWPAVAQALPAFARQMDLQCVSCHTEFPILNDFGRTFKLTGYTSSADTSSLPPLAFFLQPSFTHTESGQAGGAAPGFGGNNNFAVTQASVFYAGRLFGPYANALFGPDVGSFLNKIGIFSQGTYDGIAKAWHWDNTEVRYASMGEIHENDLIYGFYANNNPSLQDPWNSTPAFGFPFSSSALAPTPAAGTLIEGRLSQQVEGVGAYALYNDHFYVDVACYQTLSASFQRNMGIDPGGETQISGIAPYWRIAYVRSVGDATWQIGMIGMSAATYPGRDPSAGTDRITDVGLDSFYQLPGARGDLTLMASAIQERQQWAASSLLGDASNPSDSLTSLKLTGNYLWDKTYALTLQYFSLSGSGDPLLYSGSASGSPLSDGVIIQLDYLPFNKNGGPKFWPRSNIKFTLQYTCYNRFDGGRTNYDGAGSNASGNNTLYLETWIAF